MPPFNAIEYSMYTYACVLKIKEEEKQEAQRAKKNTKRNSTTKQ